MSKITMMVDYLQRMVDNHSVYVWGDEGQHGAELNEQHIRSQERKTGMYTTGAYKGRTYADVAVERYLHVISLGFDPYAFDCSGYVSKALEYAGVSSGRMDCDHLWAKCRRLSAPMDGALLFRVNKDDPEDETHVGVYYGGKQYHAKGRADGVVCEPYNKSYWKKIGWFKDLPTEDSAPAQTSSPHVLVLGSVNVRLCAGSVTPDMSESEKSLHRVIYTAHKNESLPYDSTDSKTGWYKVITPKGFGYISNKPRLTKLVQ